MKKLLLILLFHVYLINCTAQDTLNNYKSDTPLYWGSVSAQDPSAGFYGQEFAFSKDVELYSLSVFIVDIKGHDQTKSTVNYSILGFDSMPGKELFLSEPVAITEADVNHWKRFAFKTPFKLHKGSYLLAVGQPTVQGYVAFGQGETKDDYQSSLWMKGSFDDTKKMSWIDLHKFMASKTAVPEEQKKAMASSVVMMRLEYK